MAILDETAKQPAPDTQEQTPPPISLSEMVLQLEARIHRLEDFVNKHVGEMPPMPTA